MSFFLDRRQKHLGHVSSRGELVWYVSNTAWSYYIGILLLSFLLCLWSLFYICCLNLLFNIHECYFISQKRKKNKPWSLEMSQILSDKINSVQDRAMEKPWHLSLDVVTLKLIRVNVPWNQVFSSVKRATAMW